MTDIKMLPLPKWCYADKHLHVGSAAIRKEVRAYARANVTHATAAKDAEIEALRAEVALLRMGVCGDACLHIAIERDQLKARAEQLAEALSHQRWCRTCAEDGWENCEDGRKADALLRSTAALRDHDKEPTNGR